MKHAPRIAAVLTAAALALSACGGTGSDDSPSSSSSIPASAPFNDADVAFATEMIPHHAQALVMVDMTRGRQLDPPLEKLAQQVLEAQGPEIQEMTGWLQDWDQPIPATARDHVHGDASGDPGSDGTGDDGDMGGMDGMDGMDGDDSSTDMPGMMSDQDMSDLAHAGDATFGDMWLRMMIQHHEGAIEMARTEVSEGEYPDAIALARSIERSQARQIDQMKAMLAS